MATQWQGPHFIAIVAASALAFGGGYLMAGRSRPAPSALPPAVNTSNGVVGPTGIPGFGTNGQAPAAPRGRPDENELIARNAEPEDDAQPHDMGTPRRDQQTGRRGPDRDRGRGEELPPDQPEEEDPGYGPE